MYVMYPSCILFENKTTSSKFDSIVPNFISLEALFFMSIWKGSHFDPFPTCSGWREGDGRVTGGWREGGTIKRQISLHVSMTRKTLTVDIDLRYNDILNTIYELFIQVGNGCYCCLCVCLFVSVSQWVGGSVCVWVCVSVFQCMWASVFEWVGG